MLLFVVAAAVALFFMLGYMIHMVRGYGLPWIPPVDIQCEIWGTLLMDWFQNGLAGFITWIVEFCGIIYKVLGIHLLLCFILLFDP